MVCSGLAHSGEGELVSGMHSSGWGSWGPSENSAYLNCGFSGLYRHPIISRLVCLAAFLFSPLGYLLGPPNLACLKVRFCFHKLPSLLPHPTHIFKHHVKAQSLSVFWLLFFSLCQIPSLPSERVPCASTSPLSRPPPAPGSHHLWILC